jgi:hypothetical protein
MAAWVLAATCRVRSHFGDGLLPPEKCFRQRVRLQQWRCHTSFASQSRGDALIPTAKKLFGPVAGIG